jgi:hypothetical protein
MLYGYRETVDNRVATLVVAGDTKNEYRNFIEVASGQVANGYRHGDDSPSNFEEMYTSLFLQHMTEELYKGYKMPVYVFYHTSNEQRELFITEFEIREVKSAAGRDRQTDMQFAEQQALRNAEKEALRKAEESGEEVENGATKTIEELYGLDKEDKWDRRSESEKQEDAEMRQKIKELQKEGKMSGDSFTGGKHDKKAKAEENPGNVHVTDIVGNTQSDGSFDISNIRAIKVGGGIDETLKEQRQKEHEAKAEAAKKGKKSFTPEDFAAVLKGDGSADHLNVKGDMDQRRGSKPIERPSLSEGAEAARKEHQEQERIKAAERAAQAKRENDLTARGDRAKGIFRGADLGGESDIPLADLPQELQGKLREALGEETTVSVKDYPYNSELAGKILLPCSGMDLAVVDGVNLKKVGTISMGDAYAVVVELEDKEQEGWAIYQWPIKGKPVAEGEEPAPTRLGTSVVRVRNA